MKVRIVSVLLIFLSWQVLPAAMVAPGQNPSLTGFLTLGMLYTFGFNGALWSLGLSGGAVELFTGTLAAWLASAFLIYTLYFESQGVSAGRYSVTLTHHAPDPTLAFYFFSFVLVLMGELLLWVQRARVVAAAPVTLPSD